MKTHNTADNNTYYSREGNAKASIIDVYIEANNDINTILDVGCNNGDMSYPLQKKYGKTVFGVDLSDNLQPPADYNFKRLDIVNDKFCNFNDCTLFLSLYHHIFGKYGIAVADDVFMKLLMRTKYLIFDTGNASEKIRTTWASHSEIVKHFKTEEELLNHFRIPYTVIGKWSAGGGSRSVVVFKASDMDNNFNVVENLQRKKDARIDTKLYVKDSINELTSVLSFYKLEYNGKYYFGKMRNEHKEELEQQEIKNIVRIYNEVDKSKLINFYGYSQKFGLIYEWLNDIKFIKKCVPFLDLKDVELIEVNGVEKYIDFER